MLSGLEKTKDKPVKSVNNGNATQDNSGSETASFRANVCWLLGSWELYDVAHDSMTWESVRPPSPTEDADLEGKWHPRGSVDSGSMAHSHTLRF